MKNQLLAIAYKRPLQHITIAKGPIIITIPIPHRAPYFTKSADHVGFFDGFRRIDIPPSYHLFREKMIWRTRITATENCEYRAPSICVNHPFIIRVKTAKKIEGFRSRLSNSRPYPNRLVQ